METTEQQQQQEQQRGGGATCPPWLQAAIADIEQRVRSLAVSAPDDKEKQHSFAERAEDYYQKRPQLLALLTDLHHRYLYLADRYSSKSSYLADPRRKNLVPNHHDDDNDNVDDEDRSSDDRSSDAGSSLSFQAQTQAQARPADDDAWSAAELMVAELVLAWVDRDVLADEAERRGTEAARKIELQGSLVEVLESERLVLLGENARLAEEAAAELGYMRRRAAEMARLVVRLREDHRVCMLGRKIEALQAQVYGLELRNRECHEAMAAWEAERKAGAAEMERLRAENRRLAAATATNYMGKKKKKKSGGGWWSRVRLAAEVGEQQLKDGKQNYSSSYYGGCFFCV